MKFLKTIFSNALVLATLVTGLAGTILIGYADDKTRPAGPHVDVGATSQRGGAAAAISPQP